MNRNSWNEYFLEIAHVTSKRSTCPSRQVGSVLVNENRNIISSGYNGAPRGTEHCDSRCLSREKGRDFDVCKAVHAEVNAIANAAYNGVSTKDTSMYCTVSPCYMCSRIMINAGIRHVFCSGLYNPDKITAWMPAVSLLETAGIGFYIINNLGDKAVLDMWKMSKGIV